MWYGILDVFLEMGLYLNWLGLRKMITTQFVNIREHIYAWLLIGYMLCLWNLMLLVLTATWLQSSQMKHVNFYESALWYFKVWNLLFMCIECLHICKGVFQVLYLLQRFVTFFLRNLLHSVKFNTLINIEHRYIS